MLNTTTLKRYAFTTIAVVVSSLLHTLAIQSFITPANLLSGGFTGIAILLNKISLLIDFPIPIGIFLTILNLPVAILCYKGITPKFTIFSLLHIGMTSICLSILDFKPISDDVLLNLIFGGVLYAFGTIIALKGNASTGGTDFISLYASTKLNRSTWTQIFIGNCIILCIFGYLFGWEAAGYSIIHQFVVTKITDTFYHRYKRLTLLITTEKGDALIAAYIRQYKHGISRLKAIGGYSNRPKDILHTVISSYEAQDVIRLMREEDPNVIINQIKTDHFYGTFYETPID